MDVRREAIGAIVRRESPRLVARLTRMLRDVGRAEELVQDALVAALERWPESGIPDNPGAWLMTAAKHRALDELRRRALVERKHGSMRVGDEPFASPDLDAARADDLGDDLLRLVFIACHPLLSREGRAAFTLRLLAGLTPTEIARAFLVTEATVAQRIVRAKRTLAEANVPFEVPRGADRSARLASVLEVIYLLFNEGYAATAGDDWLRPALCEEAIRLGRLVAELVPNEPEAHALVALMELHASRADARTGPNGAPVLLLDQDRSRWDHARIARGVEALGRVHALGGRRGPYALQAAIAGCHAVASSADETPFERIAALYAELAEVVPSPVVELNRAVALGMAFGPAVGLALVDELDKEPSLARYHWLPSVRGDLLAKLGRSAEAHREFVRAASLTHNARERELLLERAAACERAGAAATPKG